jgi:hypothetical protein
MKERDIQERTITIRAKTEKKGKSRRMTFTQKDKKEQYMKFKDRK